MLGGECFFPAAPQREWFDSKKRNSP